MKKPDPPRTKTLAAKGVRAKPAAVEPTATRARAKPSAAKVQVAEPPRKRAKAAEPIATTDGVPKRKYMPYAKVAAPRLPDGKKPSRARKSAPSAQDWIAAMSNEDAEVRRGAKPSTPMVGGSEAELLGADPIERGRKSTIPKSGDGRKRNPGIEIEEEGISSPPNSAPNFLGKTHYGQQLSEYFTMDLMDVICDAIADGATLHSVLDRADMPDRKQFFKTINKDKDFAAAYQLALQLRAEKMADELTEKADMALGRSSDDVAALKLMVQTRQWVISHLMPKKWGDKIVIAGDADNPVTTRLVLGANDLVKKIKGGA